MKAIQPIQLHYGVNLHAAHVYNNFKAPLATPFYPDFTSEELRQALADYAGVPAEMVVCGHGSDELVDVFIRIHNLKTPNLLVAEVPPNYYQYRNYAERLGAKVVSFEVDRSFLTPSLFAKAGCLPENSILMIDSPSNPAGEITSRQQFIDLLEAGYHVFADEAYFEFHGESIIDLVPKYERLVVSRSLSKIAAMAGSRVGYAIAQPQVTQQFLKHKLFFNIGLDAQARALYALERMPAFQAQLIGMRRTKERVWQDIQTLDAYHLLPSLDMYLIIKPRQGSAAQLHRYLEQEHAILTYLFKKYKGSAAVRVTVGSDADMKTLVAALQQAPAKLCERVAS